MLQVHQPHHTRMGFWNPLGAGSCDVVVDSGAARLGLVGVI